MIGWWWFGIRDGSRKVGVGSAVGGGDQVLCNGNSTMYIGSARSGPLCLLGGPICRASVSECPSHPSVQ
jgi:hypothetical protein